MAIAKDPRLTPYAIALARSEDQDLKHIESIADLIDGFTATILRKLQAWETAADTRNAA